MDTSQFFPWIKAQPDERKINMRTASFYPNETMGCGCLMVEFARDQGIKGKIMASYSNIDVQKEDGSWEVITFPPNTQELINGLMMREEMTFAEVRESYAYKHATC